MIMNKADLWIEIHRYLNVMKDAEKILMSSDQPIMMLVKNFNIDEVDAQGYFNKWDELDVNKGPGNE